MSESGSNPKVEDVLASIRRLVAEEKSGKRGSVARAAKPRICSDRSDDGSEARLILTPALRVTDGIEVPGDRPQSPQADIAVPSPRQAERSHAGDEPVSVLQLPPSARLLQADEKSEAQARRTDRHGRSDQAPAPAEDDPPIMVDDLVFKNGLGKAEDGREDTAETGKNESDVARVPERGKTDAAPDQPQKPAPLVDAELQSKIAALQAAIARHSDTRACGVVEGQQDPRDPPTATPQEATDTPRDEAPYRLEPAARRDVQERTATETPTEEDGSEADALDEEALRDLIADIVREELRGELGERITRKVRKLVRREMQRILADKGSD